MLADPPALAGWLAGWLARLSRGLLTCERLLSVAAARLPLIAQRSALSVALAAHGTGLPDLTAGRA